MLCEKLLIPILYTTDTKLILPGYITYIFKGMAQVDLKYLITVIQKDYIILRPISGYLQR